MRSPHQVFGDDDRVAGMVRIVLDAGGYANAAGVQIQDLMQVGHVLRALVLHPGHVVGVHHHLHRVATLGIQLLHVEHGSVRNAALRAEALAAHGLTLLGGFLASVQPDQRAGRGNRNGAAKAVGENAKQGHGKHCGPPDVMDRSPSTLLRKRGALAGG